MDPGYCEVYSTSAAFILHKENSSEIVYIDRSISTVSKRKTDQYLQGHSKKCSGLLGIVKLYASNYLILITKAVHVARVKESFIYLIKDLEFLPYTSIVADSPEAKKDLNAISLLRSLVLSDSFYFSYDYDLTLTIQQIAELSNPSKLVSKWERSNEKYFWNKHLCESLIKEEAHELILPVINGFVQGEYVNISGKSFDYILISRRDKRRTGTRFNTRGLDDQGNSVNFVETEQILSYWDDNNFTIFSHVQLRGSIPLIWQQKPNLAWMPKPKISNNAQLSISAAELHLKELYNIYGGVSFINLIDKKGSQKMIGTVFTNLMSLLSSKNLFYEWFDFHHECKNMKYENLRILLAKIEKCIEEWGWCEVRVQGSDYIDRASVIRRQSGVFRTNCMDCLDRTNVVQSVIARNIALRQLASIRKGPGPNGEAFQSFEGDLEKNFRELWVKNADNMSSLYAGTPAQKTDFTRLGKRTLLGTVLDGVYGGSRYFINNFFDGSKQNSIDIFLGKLSVKSGLTLKNKFESFIKFFIALLCIFVISYLSASKTDGLANWVLFALALGLLGTIFGAYGTMFVDKPILSSN